MFERHQRHLRHDTLTLNLTPAIAASDSAEDRDAARRVDGIANRMFLDPILRGTYPADIMTDLAPLLSFDHVQEGDLTTISEPIEMLGVNYYFRHFVLNTEPRQRMFDTIAAPKGTTELAAAGGVTPRAALNFINQLLELKLVRAVGAGRDVIVARDEDGIIQWFQRRETSRTRG